MFKLVLVLTVVVAVSCDVSHLFKKPSNNLLTPFNAPRQHHAPAPVRAFHAAPKQQVRVNQGNEANVQILRQESEINPDGTYQYSFETENGISVQEQASYQQSGQDQIKTAQGSFSWTSPEGQPIQITYIADENGYQPQGDLPTPPPIPAAILRALEWNAAHPQEEEHVKRF